jgi:bifunctional enzyme CysN/CysC
MSARQPSTEARSRALRVSVGGAAGAGKTALIAHLRALDAVVAGEAAPGSILTPSGEPADVLVLLSDVREGLTSEARQHAAGARAAGIRHIVLALNKLDLVDWDQTAFDAANAAFGEFAGRFEFTSAVAIPMSAQSGENVSTPGRSGDWYSGPALIAHLATIDIHAEASPSAAPEAQLTEQFAAHIVCVADQQLIPGREYKLKLAGHELTASVTAVKYRLDIDSLHRVPARTLARGEIGVCTVATHTPLVVEGFARDHDADRFTLSDLYTDETIAAGTVDFALRRGINIHWQPLTVTKEVRASLKEQRPCVVWFTGLSGAGKSTIANLVEGWLALHGCHTYLLDGDNVRHGLNKDLGFTAADRVENIRRVGEVARLFVDAGVIVLCSFISPFRAEREAVRSIVDEGEFIEIHVTAPLEVCERRDPKGLYAKSRAGQLPNFTGIDSPYEAPEHPDLVLDTTSAPAAELAQRVVALLQVRGVVMTSDVEMRMAGGV